MISRIILVNRLKDILLGHRDKPRVPQLHKCTCTHQLNMCTFSVSFISTD